jgi:hypothetical protein
MNTRTDRRRPGRLAREWRDFTLRVLPADAPPAQLVEMRRAFMAGVQVMLGINRGIGDPSVSEERGAEILEGLEAEMREFVELIREGKA